MQSKLLRDRDLLSKNFLWFLKFDHLWNFYFFAKIYLYFREFIRLDFIFNVLFLVFLVVPVPTGYKYYKPLKAIKIFI
ncbi:MAG: cellulose biosynthesis protein BcsG, partial [Proteobacteria bacterium]|nr:cellulose biosynthesis protein BcsG [Pseudomonadota bacterium]